MVLQVTSDSTVFFNGNDLVLESGIKITIKGANTKILDAPNAEGAILYYNGVEKFQVQQTGVDITGKAEISGDIAAVGVITAKHSMVMVQTSLLFVLNNSKVVLYQCLMVRH